MCSVIKTDSKLCTIVVVAVGQLTAQLQAYCLRRQGRALRASIPPVTAYLSTIEKSEFCNEQIFWSTKNGMLSSSFASTYPNSGQTALSPYTFTLLKDEDRLNIQLVPRSKHSVSVIKTSQLMLYREIIAVCSEIHTEHINTLCGQNVEFVSAEPHDK
jgi:hypothetical protein